MEYMKRKELESEPVVEPTAVTMKSIKELLAEDQARLEQAPPEPAADNFTDEAAPAAAAEPDPAPVAPVVPSRPVLQTPPAVPARSRAETLPDLQPDAPEEQHRGSLLSRLFGRS